MSTFSQIENSVKIWTFGNGFLGAIVGAFSAVGMQGNVSGQGGLVNVKLFRNFTIGGNAVDTFRPDDIIRNVKFDWTGDRSLRIVSLGGEYAFQV
jgi:hypothetical protein